MKPTRLLALLLALLPLAPASLAQTAAVTDAVTDEASQDLLTTLEERGNFTILVSALRDTGLDAALATGETFTLFAPTDEAFQELPAGTLDSLSPEQLTGVLRYHLLAGAVPSQDAIALDSAPTVQGSDLALSTTEGQLNVNDASVTEADIEASNGVIHVIDAVLMPEAKMDDASMDGEMMEKDMDDDSDMEQMEEESDMTPAPQH